MVEVVGGLDLWLAWLVHWMGELEVGSGLDCGWVRFVAGMVVALDG